MKKAYSSAVSEQGTHNSLVVGSSPTAPTTINNYTTKMSDREINEKIAAYCGWTEIEPSTFYEGASIGFPPLKDGEERSPYDPRYAIPNYLKDLNEMHEAEKKLPERKHFTYQVNLSVQINTISSPLNFALLNATARQRALAFIKTIE